jgi:signal transduction histidine kinase
MPVAVAGAVGLLTSVLLGLVVARTIARPVKLLADKARMFAAGRYDGEVGPLGPGEVGELQQAFGRMAEAIREGEVKLRESERFAVLGRLAGGIAHELRNPLTAIRMAVETATAEDAGARREARDVAVSEIERLDRTLREMLEYIQPRQPVLVDVDVAGLFGEVVALLKPQCEHLDVRLDANAPAGLVVRADGDRIKQALLNLVLNAAQAQPHGGVVRLRAAGSRLEVQDEGPGIPEEVRESLLQPFVTTKVAGIGLGLAVVQQVADEHDAELDFVTGPDGTTFTLQLR